MSDKWEDIEWEDIGMISSRPARTEAEFSAFCDDMETELGFIWDQVRGIVKRRRWTWEDTLDFCEKLRCLFREDEINESMYPLWYDGLETATDTFDYQVMDKDEFWSGRLANRGD